MSDETDNTGPRTRRDLTGWPLAAMVVLMVSLIWMVYRPDRARPFHIVDFAEFIPLLDSRNDFLGRLLAVMEYYGDAGRLNVLPYVLLAAKWEFFGWSVAHWQVARALTMLLAFCLTFVLLRRLGASRLGGVIGATVFFWAPSAIDGWIRLTMGEPLAVVIALGMSIRATRFQAATRWRLECLILGIGTAALVLTKELLAPLLILPLVLGLARQPDGRFSWPRLSLRNAALLATVSVALLATMLPVVLTFVSSADSSYASLYGRGLQSPLALLAIWIAGLVPFDLILASPSAGWIVALCGFIVLLASGWRVGLQTERQKNQARWLLGLALVVPLTGVLAYLPSPWFMRFYMLPYLIGAALLTGMAATYVQDAFRGGVALASGAWAGMAIFAITSASATASRADAVQRRDDRVIAFVADSSDADTIYFATTNLSPADWLAEASPTGAPRGLGATLFRFARASNRRWPTTLEASCQVAQDALSQSNRIAVVNLENTCKFETHAAHSIEFPFRHFDWRRVRIASDTTRARVLRGRTAGTS